MAVNGTIGAVGLTFTQDGTPQTFATVVPDSLFQPGTNRVRLYQVEPGRADARRAEAPSGRRGDLTPNPHGRAVK